MQCPPFYYILANYTYTMIRIRIGIILAILFSITTGLWAQNMPVGQWQSHLPYNTAVSIAYDGGRIYVATQHSFYIYEIATDEVTPFSKVGGMSDIGVTKIAWDGFTETAIICYQNGNIDLYSKGSFYNIPDLKIKSVAGTKNINHILTNDGIAYISSDVGILVLNLDKAEVKETYTFSRSGNTIPIHAVTIANNSIYAATGAGLYSISATNANPQAFQAWTKIDTVGDFKTVVSLNNTVYTAQADQVFELDADTLRSVYAAPDSSIRTITEGRDGIWIIQYFDTAFNGFATKMAPDYQIVDSFVTNGLVEEIIEMKDDFRTMWIANQFSGLVKRVGSGEPFGTVPPDGPGDVPCFDVSINGKNILVAHGGYDDKYNPIGTGTGFSVYKDDKWTNYRRFSYPPFGDSVVDFTNILQAPSGDIYAGSAQSGLFVLRADGTFSYYKQNSFIDPSSTGETLYRVSGMTIDNDGVLWLTVYGGSPHELVAIMPDGTSYQFRVNAGRTTPNAAAHIITDDLNQKWYAAPTGGGVIVYDDNHTPETPFDDKYIQLFAGEGSGGLPDNEVYSLAKDRDGSIWIGTNNGIGIVSCPSQVIQRQCEAERRIVQFDQFAGYLFQNEQVRTIAVDGANRKWIGTNNGVWLLTPNGDAIVSRFTTENSPLPSNIIQKITINNATGEVYIGTERGLMSYRGTATEGSVNNKELLTFPNPVPSGYNGTIAIRGFSENADVRITDVSGQLVYRTTALGGQAVWNGRDYTGRRPQSGVYLIFGTNKDGTETIKGKMVFME